MKIIKLLRSNMWSNGLIIKTLSPRSTQGL